MGFLFAKKKTVQAMAELLEDGRAMSEDKMSGIRYRDYEGREPKIEVAVRVLPEYQTPYQTTMKAGISCAFLLLPGVQVQVKYEPDKQEPVELDDNPQAILDRNPQLRKKE